jgi:triacylglycerol lipase
MGAIVARHYLQCRGGARRARAYFSIAGPHQGTLWAPLGPGQGARELRRGSPFLRDLDRGLGALGGVPVRTYRAPLDLMVVPGSTTRLPGATEVVTWCPLHSLLPGDPAVMDDITAALARVEGIALGAAPKPAII